MVYATIAQQPRLSSRQSLSFPSPSSKKHSRIELQPTRALRPGVQIARRGGDVAVPQGRLDFGQRGAAVDRVAGVGMAQPMRRDRRLDASTRSSTLDDAEHGALVEPATALAAGE